MHAGELLEEAGAGGSGQAEVEQHQVGVRVLRGELLGTRCVDRGEDVRLRVEVEQQDFQRIGDQRVIVNQKDFHCLARSPNVACACDRRVSSPSSGIL